MALKFDVVIEVREKKKKREAFVDVVFLQNVTYRATEQSREVCVQLPI